MKIATLQSVLFWEDTSLNLRHFDLFLARIDSDVDVVVLPEMFTTGFSMNAAKISSEMGGEGLQWMIKKAKELNKVLVGSIAVKEGNHYFNRLFWVQPDQTYTHYDKRHLFRMASEDKAYTAGNEKIIVQYKGIRFALFVCYDLRFPVWSRNIELNAPNNVQPAYDCAIYVANWPAVRSAAWNTLLQARAIENLCYVVGVNRVGTDGNGIEYDGKSNVFDFKGMALAHHIDYAEGIAVATLDLDALNQFRTQFPAFLDADFNLV